MTDYSEFDCKIKIDDVCDFNNSKSFTQINPYCVRRDEYTSMIKCLDLNKVFYEVKRTHEPIYYFKHFLFEQSAFSNEKIFKIKLGEIKISDLNISDVCDYYEPEHYNEEIYGSMSSLEIENKIKSLQPEILFESLKEKMIDSTHIFNPDYTKVAKLFICEVGDFYTSKYDKLTFNEALEIFKENSGQYCNVLQYDTNREYEENELSGLTDSEILARLLFNK